MRQLRGVFITPNADGSVRSLRVEGRNLIFFNAGELGPGQQVRST